MNIVDLNDEIFFEFKENLAFELGFLVNLFRRDFLKAKPGDDKFTSYIQNETLKEFVFNFYDGVLKEHEDKKTNEILLKLTIHQLSDLRMIIHEYSGHLNRVMWEGKARRFIFTENRPAIPKERYYLERVGMNIDYNMNANGYHWEVINRQSLKSQWNYTGDRHPLPEWWSYGSPSLD